MAFVSWIPQGRAGNFYMEAFAAFAYSKRHGLDFSVPKSTNSDFHSPIYSHHLQHPDYNPNAHKIIVREPHFHYAPIEFNEAWRGQDILLCGYFQSFKHWDEYRNEIITAFNFPWKLIPDTCSIQARFGDYKTIEGKHVLVNEEYLFKAMALINKKTGIKKFKVFSDELDFFKSEFGHLYDFGYSTNNDIIADLFEISCCHSNINSSSTFSWVAAYINQNPDKVIITQDRWFAEGWSDGNGIVYTGDLIPETWIKL